MGGIESTSGDNLHRARVPEFDGQVSAGIVMVTRSGAPWQQAVDEVHQFKLDGEEARAGGSME